MIENEIYTLSAAVSEQKPPCEEAVAVILMTDIELQEVQWFTYTRIE